MKEMNSESELVLSFVLELETIERTVFSIHYENVNLKQWLTGKWLGMCRIQV